MEQVAIEVIKAMSPATLPLVVVVVAFGYLFFKFRGIQTDRSETKVSRDKDSQELHDKVLKLEFSDSLTKDTLLLHRQRIDEVNTATQQLTTQLAVVVTKLDNIIDVLNALKKDGK